MNSTDAWRARAVDASEVVRRLPARATAFVHGACATPTPLIDALVARSDLDRVELWHLHLGGPIAFAAPQYADRIHSVSLFTSPALRDAIAEGRADFVPIFLSDIPALFTSGQVRLDAALVQVSPPDAHGNCSLGTSVDAARAATSTARLILAEINARMPRTHGDTIVPFERIDAFCVTDRPLAEHEPDAQTPVTAAIGEHVAALIDHGATLQLGIGAIPDAVLARLHDKLDLGLHTEMFSDGVVELVEHGVITNRRKKTYVGRSVTSFVHGSRRVFDFVDDNPQVEFLPCDLTNDPAHIRKNDAVTAINSALAIDVTGQVCADSIGSRIYSGIGGQLDFLRGAALSRGGKPILALPSTAKDGTISRIVRELAPGSGVVTTRGHVHWVVTEYGAVNLHGATLRERRERLASIAHPEFRTELLQP
ncbi:MAG: acetyl-CoA hydrolase/transferase family protein [Planctomycetes bacterium]|nr:acetyl-CoA hydrolase/transferase family protein [Planctomycetota bacterium]